MNDGISIKVGEIFIDLKPTTTIQATFNNPIFNTELIEGNYSLPFSIDWTPTNRKVFEFIEVVASTKEFYTEKDCEVFIQGVLFYAGTIRIKKTSTGEYFATLLVTAPDLRSVLKNNSMIDIDLGGDQQIAGGNLTAYRANLKAIGSGTSLTHDFALFPVFNPIAISTVDFTFFASWINQYRSNNFNKSATGGFFNEPKCPYPYVIYVFEQLFSGNNYQVIGSFFKDAEIRTLCIHNNYLEDDGNIQLNYNLKNHVPDISQVDFLIRLKNKFNLGYFFNHDTKEIEVVPLKELLENPDYDDWTDRVGPVEEVSQALPSTYTLKMAYDTTDAVFPGRYKALNGLSIVATVEKFGDLPAATQQMGDDNEARLVRSINQYWFVFLDPPFAPSWKYYSDNYYDFQVGDDLGRNIEIDSKISTLVQDPKTNQISGELQYTPNIRQQCSTEFGDKEKFPFGFSLLFNRGLFASDIGGKNYPMGSSHNYDLQENRIAEYSLKMDGADGIYERWYKSWLGFLIGKKTVVRQNRLDVSELKSYVNGSTGWKKKIRINDVEFIQKMINVTFTMTGIEPANITLYSIPFTPAVPVPAGTLTGGFGGAVSVGGTPYDPGPREPKDGGEPQQTEGIEAMDPAEGMRIGPGLLKGNKLTGLDIKQQASAVYRYDEMHFEEVFTAASFNYADDEITFTDHSFIVGDTVRFVSTAGLPAGLVEGVAYYVVEGSPGGDIFKVSATKGGVAIDISAPAGGVGGSIHSNDLFDIGLRVFIPENAIITRTWVENLDSGGSASASGSDSGSGTEPEISFHLQVDNDILDPLDQSLLFPATGGDFIDGKHEGEASKFQKLTAEREVIMKVESNELLSGDYLVNVEYGLSE